MRVLAGMAFLAVGCGGGDFASRVNQDPIGGDAGPRGAGGMALVAAGGHDTAGFGAGGAAGAGGAPGSGGMAGAAGRPTVVTCHSDIECGTNERCVEPFPDAPMLQCAKPCAVADYSVIYDNCPSDGRSCMVDHDCVQAAETGKCSAGRCLTPCNKPLPSVPCVTGVCATIAGTRIIAPDCRRGASLFCVDSDGQLGHCGT